MKKRKLTPTQNDLLKRIKENSQGKRFFCMYKMKKQCNQIKSFDLSFNALFSKGYLAYTDKPLNDTARWYLL